LRKARKDGNTQDNYCQKADYGICYFHIYHIPSIYFSTHFIRSKNKKLHIAFYCSSLSRTILIYSSSSKPELVILNLFQDLSDF